MFYITEKVLLEQYKGGTKLVGDDDIYGPYNVPGGIPFNGKVFSNIYVSGEKSFYSTLTLYQTTIFWT